MNKYINSKVILMIFITIFSIMSCGFLENKTIHVPKKIIQGKIDKKFPMTKNYLLAKVTLKNPEINFKEEKMYITSEYEASFLDEKVKGEIFISSNIKYDNKKEELYLVNFSIDKITDSSKKEIMNSKTENILKELINNYLETKSVYNYGEEYEEKNSNSEKKKIKIKNMFIKKGKFYVQT
ncbi:MAG: DUF1439 domain-containing protein [Leptotrichiaceae bacterium]|nr:DUF1439 domain-containing protein [Leptotrichiaceae bacterium]MBP7100766.1 DUF1439 domain-containing protein [Leptotrichiaceae bacterium]MBP7739290.1 DUF1439 domain-containing protein [Leptotrichiaceae bacterium]MBP9628982.1 DUF1439 domain-containing protein [Leptotrichiaceae bacterium]